MIKYDSYKSSGIEWLGEIPSHWEIKKLKYLSKIKTGEKDTENKIDDGIYPFFVRSDKVERINTYSFEGEAVLTAGDGVGVGKVFHYIDGKFEYHQRVYKISNFNDISGKYFFYFLKENFHKEVLKLSAKSTVDSIRLPMLANFNVSIPPKKEQEAIANFLDKKLEQVDNYISKQKELIELLKEKKSSLINQAVTKGLDPKVEYKESGIEWLGKIPKHWEVKKLKYLVSLNPSVKVFDIARKEKIEFLPMENIDEKQGKIKKFNFRELNEVRQGYTPFRNNDIIFAKITPCMENGNCAIIKDTKFNLGYGSTEFVVFRTSFKIIVEYMYFILRNKLFRNVFEFNMRGSAGQKRISTDFLSNFEIAFPLEKQEQQQIVEYIEIESSKIDKVISTKENEVKLLDEYKQSLISSAVTGKIKVS